METCTDKLKESGVKAPHFCHKTVPAVISAPQESSLEYIDYVPTPIGKINKRSGLTVTIVSSMLIRLEL